MLDPNVWVPFLSALTGALVGGFASALGSHVVARADRVRTTRETLYLELIPQGWSETWGPQEVEDDDLWDAMARAGRTCRRRDAHLANSARDLAAEARRTETAARLSASPDGQGGLTNEHDPFRVKEANEAMDRLNRHMETWSDWLEKKLS